MCVMVVQPEQHSNNKCLPDANHPQGELTAMILVDLIYTFIQEPASMGEALYLCGSQYLTHLPTSMPTISAQPLRSGTRTLSCLLNNPVQEAL
jgi:hypothetical protein